MEEGNAREETGAPQDTAWKTIYRRKINYGTVLRACSNF